jgi:hypothetical protein
MMDISETIAFTTPMQLMARDVFGVFLCHGSYKPNMVLYLLHADHLATVSHFLRKTVHINHHFPTLAVYRFTFSYFLYTSVLTLPICIA